MYTAAGLRIFFVPLTCIKLAAALQHHDMIGFGDRHKVYRKLYICIFDLDFD